MSLSLRYSSILLIVVLACFSGPVYAQCDVLQWGEVPPEHVALTEYPADPDASAVILGDCGEAAMEMSSNTSPRITLRRHVRVKVLNEAGYDLGDVVLYHRARGEDIRRVRGQTLVPRADGRLRRVELDRRSIFEEDAGDGFRTVTFTLPALEPGAIFEYAYEYRTDYFITFPRWEFQATEPTLHSEYVAAAPNTLGYAGVGQGLEDVELIRDQRVLIDGTTINEARWIARDVPALREEPYMTTPSDYVKRVELQLQSVPGYFGGVEDFLATWEQVAQALGEHQRFGRQLEPHRSVRRQAEEVTAGLADPRDRAKAVYDFVRTAMVWNEQSGVFISDRLDRTLQTRTGSSADINLLLLSMLRAAGVPAQPVLISTRAHGRVRREYPLVSQFNYVVVRAEAGGEAVFLDATDPDRPYGMLPVQALAGTGWVPEPGGQRWIDVGVEVPTTTTTRVTATVAPDGSLAGTLDLRVTDYAALRVRHRLREEAAAAPGDAAAAAAADASDADEGVDLDVTAVTGVADPDEAIVVTAGLSAQAAEQAGDELYLAPFLLMGIDENPFKLEVRTFPVDFGYPFQRTYAADIALPDGYVPEELPEPVQYALPRRGALYSRAYSFENGVLQVRAELEINQAVFTPSVYPALRRFYNQIVAAETEALVLVPQAAAPSSVAEEAPPATDADAQPPATDAEAEATGVVTDSASAEEG